MEQKPVVNWQSPETTPEVEKYESESFWIAVKSLVKDGWRESVFEAQYVNKPLEYDESDSDCENPLDDNHFVNVDGEPMEAVGWYCVRDHSEFSDFYEPITFGKEYVLLGWGNYIKPDFTPNS